MNQWIGIQHQEQKSGYVKGGTFTDIETFTFYKPDLTSGGFYQITYWDAGDGIINYDYHLIRPQKVEVKESVVAAEAIVMCLLLLLSVPALAVA